MVQMDLSSFDWWSGRNRTEREDRYRRSDHADWHTATLGYNNQIKWPMSSHIYGQLLFDKGGRQKNKIKNKELKGNETSVLNYSIYLKGFKWKCQDRAILALTLKWIQLRRKRSSLNVEFYFQLGLIDMMSC